MIQSLSANVPCNTSTLAAEPPLVSTPPALSGKPSQRRNQPITTSSTWLAPLATSQMQALTL